MFFELEGPISSIFLQVSVVLVEYLVQHLVPTYLKVQVAKLLKVGVVEH